MAIDPSRIRNRLTSRPDSGGKAYMVGVAPDGDNVPDFKTEYAPAMRVRWEQAFILRRMKAEGIDRTNIAAMSALAMRASRAWTQPTKVPGLPSGVAVQGGMSPKKLTYAAWNSRLHYYVAEDPDAQRLIREEPFVFPCTCLSEGVYFTERLYPGAVPNIVIGEGKEQCLVPYRGTDPGEVAKWWFYMHAQGMQRIDVTQFKHPAGGIVEGER